MEITSDTVDKDCRPGNLTTSGGCTRAPTLVISLAKIKEQQARSVMRDVHNQVHDIKRTLKTLVAKSKYLEILKRVSAAKAQAWNKANTRHKNKMIFLVSKMENFCRKHVEQRAWANVRAGRTPRTHRDSRNDNDDNKSKPQPQGGPGVDPLLSGTKVSDKDLDAAFGDPAGEVAGQEVIIYGQLTWDTNMKLILPQPRPSNEEAVLGTRLGVWKETASNYVSNHCLKGGVQKTHNLTTSERVGLGKLKKRIQAGELVVLKSDKGNRFTGLIH